MHGGNAYEGFQLLTGLPSIMYHSNKYDSQKLHDLIRHADESKYPMSASCSNGVGGLVSSHAYTLLGVSGNDILVRNPWATENYKVNNKISGDGVNDGRIVLSVAIFKQAFRSFTINYNREWKTTTKTMSIPQSQPGQSIKFKNDVQQEVIVGMVGRNGRHLVSSKASSNEKFALMGV